MRRILGWLVVAAAVTTPVSAQDVTLRGRGDLDNDRYLSALIRDGGYTFIGRDTTLAAGDTLRGDVLVAAATLRVNGVIAGDLVIVDANVFLRPSARVLGNVRNIGGGFYPSDLAAVQGRVDSEPSAAYIAERNALGDVVITGITRRSALTLPQLFGLQVPTYDRVDGVTLGMAAELAFPRIGSLEPLARGRVDYHSQRGAWGGMAEAALARNRTELAGGVERVTATNERWIRGDLSNSISALVTGRDRRDYWQAERAYVEARRLLEERTFGENGTRTTRAWVRGQVEEASSLAAGDPWSLLGDLDDRPNMPVDDGRITSLTGGAATEWLTPRFAIEADAELELASSLLDGEHDFQRYLVHAAWAMPTIADHTLEIEAHAQGPLPGTTSLPRQRWSFVGGGGTLYTFEDAEFRGDRVVFVETDYSIPLPARLSAGGMLGVPSLELLHVVGMAWTADSTRSWEQNVGARLRFSVLWFRAVTNPKDFSGDAEFSVGVSFPRRPWPWQREF